MVKLVKMVELTSDLAPQHHGGNGGNNFCGGPLIPKLKWWRLWSGLLIWCPSFMVEMVEITSVLAPQIHGGVLKMVQLTSVLTPQPHGGNGGFNFCVGPQPQGEKGGTHF